MILEEEPAFSNGTGSLFRVRKHYLQFSSLFWKCIPILLAALALIAIGWAARILLQHPYTGLVWSYQTGTVLNTDLESPAFHHFEKGDRIVSIDGVAPYEARGLPGRNPGDLVTFVIERGENHFQIQLILDNPPPKILFNRLSTLLAAMSFWLLGILVVAYSQRDKLTSMFFLFSHTFAAVLALGAISAYSPLWSGWLFSLMLWWIGPFVLHTHLLLARPELSSKQVKALFFVYSLAFIFTLVDLARLSSAILHPLQTIKYLWLGLILVFATLILINASRMGKPMELRRKTRIAGLSALIAFLPFVLFSLIPEALFGYYALPYEVSFLFLPVLPLGYSYAILRYRLISIERYVNRSFAYTLVALVVGGLYGLAFLIAPQVLEGKSESVSLIGFGTALILIFTAYPLYRILQRCVDKVFYGGWYDDRAVVKQVSRSLTQAEGDVLSIASTLCQALQKTLQLEYVNLILFDGRIASTQPLPQWLGESIASNEEPKVVKFFDELRKSVGREIGSGPELAGMFHLTAIEKRWILGRKPQFWLLLGGKNSYQGLLVLGFRQGGGEFAPRDLEILEVVIRQAGAALENEFLLEEVRQHSDQIKDLHRQALKAREEERKRVARDLHDKIVQAIVGINYHLSNMRIRANQEIVHEFADLQAELRLILVDLRQLCADLRPPALDVVGLIPTIESRIAELQALVSFDIDFYVDEVNWLDIPEEVALCVYRFFQEAILNVQKHADASSVTVRFCLSEDNRLTISIKDNGRGFEPPANLGLLAQQRHFGLVGLQEQVEAVGGELIIHSEFGGGCCIAATIPIKEKAVDKTES